VMMINDDYNDDDDDNNNISFVIYQYELYLSLHL
jgi:hypothetical protein